MSIFVLLLRQFGILTYGVPNCVTVSIQETFTKWSQCRFSRDHGAIFHSQIFNQLFTDLKRLVELFHFFLKSLYIPFSPHLCLSKQHCPRTRSFYKSSRNYCFLSHFFILQIYLCLASLSLLFHSWTGFSPISSKSIFPPKRGCF